MYGDTKTTRERHRQEGRRAWKRIASLLSEREWLQKDLEAKAGLKATRTSLWKGGRIPEQEELEAVARAFGVPVSKITRGHEFPGPPRTAGWSPAERGTLSDLDDQRLRQGGELDVDWIEMAAKKVGRTAGAVVFRLQGLGRIPPGQAPEWQRRIRNTRSMARYHTGHRAVSREVRDRDQRCLVCDAVDKLHAHHIEPLRESGRSVASDMVTVCSICHRRLDGKGRIKIGEARRIARAFSKATGVRWRPGKGPNGSYYRFERAPV